MSVPSPTVRKSFTTRYIELDADLTATCAEYGISELQGYAILSSREGKAILSENEFITDQFFAYSHAEIQSMYRDAWGKLMGLIPVPMVTTDRDGNVHEHVAKKFHAPEVRGLLSDMARINGLGVRNAPLVSLNFGDLGDVTKKSDSELIAAINELMNRTKVADQIEGEIVEFPDAASA